VPSFANLCGLPVEASRLQRLLFPAYFKFDGVLLLLKCNVRIEDSRAFEKTFD
jgi:hypothetical protein